MSLRPGKLLHRIQQKLELVADYELGRLIVLLNIRLVSLHIPIKPEDIYGNGRADRRHQAPEELSGQIQRNSTGDEQSKLDKLNSELDPSLSADSRLNPRAILRTFKAINAIRIVTTLWYVYMIIKFSLTDQLLERLSPGFDWPLQCYLAGRFVAYEGLSQSLALIFSLMHISWRLSQARERPYRLSVVYFLLLSERDLERVYTELGPSEMIELTIRENDQLSGRLRMVLETMCFMVQDKTKVVYKLRSNRTRSSHLRLRQLLNGQSCAFALLFMVVSSTVHIAVFVYIASYENYLKLYPNCARRRDQVGAGERVHRLFALAMDTLENLIVHTEGGIIYSGIIGMVVLNFDLINLWKPIGEQIERLTAAMSLDNGTRVVAFERRTIIGKSAPNRFRGDVDEIIARINDFFNQVARANQLISTFLIGMFAGLLLVCGLLTYHSHLQGIERPPTQVGLIAGLFLVWIVTASFGFLMVRGHCEKSYTKLCSLIANDPEKDEHRFLALFESYRTRRFCFTLSKQVPFMPTTFFNMIGWMFSSFCIISGLLRDGRIQTTRSVPEFRTRQTVESIWSRL